jgi:hypothetical protein
MLSLTITAVSMTTSATLLQRKPVVVALDQCGNIEAQAGAAPLESEAEKAARRYLDYRYTWKPETQGANLAMAKSFVAPQSFKAFEKSAADLISFSKGKNVAQRIYPTSITVDAKDGRILATADRFTEIQGLKAATLLRVTLTFQPGPRTYENPWGIYVIKEEEAQ